MPTKSCVRVNVLTMTVVVVVYPFPLALSSCPLARMYSHFIMYMFSSSFTYCLVLPQTAKGAKIYSAAVAATADGQQTAKEGEEKVKLHTHSYCCLDYSQVHLFSLFLLYM